MKLYLIQHAEEADRELDEERHLSAAGIRDIEAVGAFLERTAPCVPVIIHSGKNRARQTAERVAKHIGTDASVEEAPGLMARDDAAPWLDRLNGLATDAAIISHMPFLSKLASLLLTGREDDDMLDFQKGTVACLESNELGEWRLVWMVPPSLVVR